MCVIYCRFVKTTCRWHTIQLPIQTQRNWDVVDVVLKKYKPVLNSNVKVTISGYIECFYMSCRVQNSTILYVHAFTHLEIGLIAEEDFSTKISISCQLVHQPIQGSHAVVCGCLPPVTSYTCAEPRNKIRQVVAPPKVELLWAI